MPKAIPYGHTQLSPTWHVLRIPRVTGDVAFFGTSKSAVEQKEYNYWRREEHQRKNQRLHTAKSNLRAHAIARATQNRLAIAAAADRYRQEMPHLAGRGVVIVNTFHEAAGWMDRLRDPQGWEPGCAAVDVSGSIWVALDGDSYNGAQRWEQIHMAEEPGGPLSHLPPHLRDFAREEQAKALASSANQRGIRHAI